MLSATLILGATLAFAPPSQMATRMHISQQQPAVAMMAKGFGPPKAPPPEKAKAAKPKSDKAVARDKAAQDLEKLKEQGSPEYMVLVREVPEGAEPSKWYPVGGLAVPRSSSIDVSLSLAIFQNEEDLLKGAYRAFPFLKQSTQPLECEHTRRASPIPRAVLLLAAAFASA